jgi:hypothetical protein
MKTVDYTKIKSFKAACKATGEDPNAKKFTTGTKRSQLLEKIITSIKAINGQFKADPANDNQVKYEIVWYFDKKLGRFVYDSYYRWYYYCVSGPHFQFENSDKAKHFGSQKEFQQMWTDFQLSK